MRRISFCLCALSVALVAQAQSLTWKVVPNVESPATSQLSQYSSFDADPKGLREMLRVAPQERFTNFGYVVYMPNPDGMLERFRLSEYNMQSPAVARQTGVRTYTAQGVDDPAATAKFDIGPNGFFGMVLSPN